MVEGLRIRRGELKAPGTYRISVEVRDPTPWVILDDEKLLRQERSWTVVVPEAEERGRPRSAGGD